MPTTTQINETLYKMDSKGKIRRWEISIGEDEIGPFYEQTHGLHGGKLQTTRTHVTQGKNIGRSNETTAEQQCQMEAESIWTKKRDRSGYSVDMPEDKPKLPMLAKSYDKDGSKIKWPAYAQPKLDGIRCFAIIGPDGVKLQTRTGKTINSLPHINEELQGLYDEGAFRWAEDGETVTLDGELYNHVYKDDFQSLVSVIKRDKPSEKSIFAQFHCYDICCEEVDFEGRLEWMIELDCVASGISVPRPSACKHIQFVQTYKVQTENCFKERYSAFIEIGYEGAMIRNAAGVYQYNRRSPDLQKFKNFMDAEFEIVGAYQNKGKMVNQCTFVCVTEEGTEFGVKPKGDEALREQYWRDFQDGKLTGKMLTVRFFEWTTSDQPVPRFPIGVAIRDYE